ncbi:beta-galactosidase, partial [hydrothermal vent metagenome]
MGARTLELLRRWTLRPDPEDVGLGQEWWDTPPKDGWVSCRADEPWQKVLGGAFDGVAWYRRRARLPRKWLGRNQCIRLWFGAVATDCRVWVNGVEVGTHIGDAVPFEFDITEALDGNERCEIVCRVEQIRGHRPESPSHESSTHE